MTGSKAGLGQRILWRIEALGYDLVTAGLRLLPVDAASALGGNLLKLVGPLSGAHHTAHRNLRLAFPDLSPERRAEIVKAQWENFGRYIAEMTMMDRLTPANGRVEIVGAERLAKIAADHTPTVFVSGHLSNMEIMPSAILASGVDCVITGRALNNPHVNERLIEDRRRYGVVLFAPKGSDGTREMLQALKQGRSVALMNDQKNNQGIAAPFFGHLCHTASGPTKMALRTGGVIQPMSVQRLKGARFRVVVHDPIILAQTGDKHADVVAGVVQINAFIEARVRERPEEWFWVHRRWAKEAYDSLESAGPG